VKLRTSPPQSGAELRNATPALDKAAQQAAVPRSDLISPATEAAGVGFCHCTTLDGAVATYRIQAFDEQGHMVETFELEHDTDGQALATAKLLMMPGERGEVWDGRRLVGEIRYHVQAMAI
jgi:hypothetical protein